jgi:uncharacterized SAM-binding protein YcdF (DUF218 family)
MQQGMKRLFLCLGMLALAACRYYRFETRRELLLAADVIVVPGHELDPSGAASHILWNRVLMGKILMDRGLGARLLFTGGNARAGVTEAERMAQIAAELGVAASAIELEPRAASSFENSRRAAALIAKRGWRSGLVVSDPQHLRYAVPVFRDAFCRRGLALGWAPVEHTRLANHPQARRPT